MNYRTPNILKSFSGLLPLMMVAAPLFSSGRESSSDKAADNVALAEDALVNRDYRYAVTVCDSLVSAPGFEALGVDRLCRLSMLCVRLADAGAIEGEFATALAVRSLSAALLADSDSVASFIACLPVEERGRMMLVNSISRSRMLPFEIKEYIDPQ